jgi:hypothetical protein
MDLLDRRIAAPESQVLAAELGRLDAADDDYEVAGPLRFASGEAGEPIRATRKIMLGVGTLLVIALIGLVFGINAISDSSARNDAAKTTQVDTAGAGTADNGARPGDTPAAPAVEPKKLALTADQVRIVDPPRGDRDDTGEAQYVVDGDKETAWDTAGYKQSNFGNFKSGMGVLIDLGEQRTVSEVYVEASAPGVTMEIRTGTSDPGDTSAGDKTVVETYKPVNDSGPRKTDGTREAFGGFDPDTKYQYILVWLTDLPRADDGAYRISISNIEVHGV